MWFFPANVSIWCQIKLSKCKTWGESIRVVVSFLMDFGHLNSDKSPKNKTENWEVQPNGFNLHSGFFGLVFNDNWRRISAKVMHSKAQKHAGCVIKVAKALKVKFDIYQGADNILAIWPNMALMSAITKCSFHLSVVVYSFALPRPKDPSAAKCFHVR